MLTTNRFTSNVGRSNYIFIFSIVFLFVGDINDPFPQQLVHYVATDQENVDPHDDSQKVNPHSQFTDTNPAYVIAYSS